MSSGYYCSYSYVRHTGIRMIEEGKLLEEQSEKYGIGLTSTTYGQGGDGEVMVSNDMVRIGHFTRIVRW